MRYRIGLGRGDKSQIQGPDLGLAVALQVLQKRAIDHHISSDEIR